MFKKKINTVSFMFGLFLAAVFFSAFACTELLNNNLPTNHASAIRTSEELPAPIQSYSNDTFNLHFPNLDETSTFTVPCPTEAEFGSTRTEIKIENIVTPDIDLIIEDDGVNGNKDFTASNPCAAQFTVPNDCIIESVSVRLSNSDAQEAKIQVALFSYDSENYRPAGTDQYDEYATLANFEFPKQTYNEWYTISGLTQLLDNSETDNNKWYIGLYDNSIGGGNAYWSYTRDDSLYSGDGVDDSECIQHLNKWNYVQDTEIPSCNVDFGLKIKLASMNNSSKPSDIQLEINGIPVADGIENSGTWNTENQGMIDEDGTLDFEITADWEGVSCDVSEVHIEYGIIDDDNESPEITYTYSGDYTDANPGEITVVATDASGLSFDPSGTHAVPEQPGIYEFTFTATDNDLDRAGDSLTTTITTMIEIIDDDTEAPEITYYYSGDYTDANPGELTVIATDASGLSFDPSGTYEISGQLGVYEFTFTATDNDLDRAGDSLTTTIMSTIEIVDDDTKAPEITYSYSGDHTDANPGELIVVATDASGLSFDPSGTYAVSSQPGVCEFIFTATDNDLDRAGDSLTTTIIATIEIIEEQVMPADPLELIMELIDFATDNIEDKWTQKSLLRRFEHLKWEVLRFRIDRTYKDIERIERALARYYDRGDVSEVEMTVMLELLHQIRDVINIPIDIIDELLEFATENIEKRSTQKKLVRKLERLKKNVLKGKTCKSCRDIKRIRRDLTKYLRKEYISESEMETMMELLQQVRDTISNPGDILEGFFRFLMESFDKKCWKIKHYFKHSCKWFHVKHW